MPEVHDDALSKTLQDGHKLYWHLDRVHSWQQGELIAPIYVEVSPVSFCNHRCIFCGIDFAREGKRSLKTEIMAEKLRQMGEWGVRSVMFAGEGEPLLHPGLEDMVAAAKSSGVDVSITTNGNPGSLERFRALLPNLTWIRFSVDAGTPEIYSKVHGVGPGAFEKTLSSIRSAVEVKKTEGLDVTIGVQFLLLDENIDDLTRAVELFSGIGVDYISLKPYSLHPQMIKKKDVDYTETLVNQVQANLDRAELVNGTKLIFRKQALDVYKNKSVSFSRCRALPFWGYIDSKADFYTCSVFIGKEKFRAGNFHEQEVPDVLFGPRRKKSVAYGHNQLIPGDICRVNCRMARVNEFLQYLDEKPDHVNFI